MPNIAISYLYRDADNYKAHGVTVFANPGSRSVEFVSREFQVALSDHVLSGDVLHFRPEWVGLPPLFLFLHGYERTEADLDYHEIDRIAETTASANDPTGRTIDGLLRDLNRTHRTTSAARRA